ncbi:hypothetical protein T02_7303, partial [Trichinella nativa]
LLSVRKQQLRNASCTLVFLNGKQWNSNQKVKRSASCHISATTPVVSCRKGVKVKCG